MNAKKILSIALAMAMVLSMAACGGKTQPAASGAPAASDAPAASGSAPAASAGKTRATTNGKAENSLTISYTRMIECLDPQLFTMDYEDRTLTQCYETLFRISPTGEIVLVLAESMTANEDGSYTFVLRDGVKFHSGDILKTEDIEYALSRIENSAICSPLYGNVEISVADDRTFTISFPNAAAGQTFDALSFYLGYLYIPNKSFYEQHISDPNENIKFNEDGTGPYVFASQAVNGDIVLERFEEYWGETSLDTINIKMITGSEEMAFESGDIDFAPYTPSNFKLIREYSNVYPHEQLEDRTTYFFPNCVEGTPTNDIRVREAIVRCMDREVLADVMSDGAGVPAYSIFTPFVKDFADNADHFEMDLDKANSLMADAGYSESNKLAIEIITLNTNVNWVAACEVLKEMLEQSYFTVSITEVPDMTRYYAYDFDIAVISIGLPATTNAYSCLFDMDTGLDLAGIVDDALLASFADTVDPAKAQAVQKAATETLAYIPIFYNASFYAFDDQLNVGTYNANAGGWNYKEFSWK